MKKKILLPLLLILIYSSIFADTFLAASDKGLYVIPVKGEIGPAISSFVSEQLEMAKKANSEIVILDIDTLGGKLDSTLKIQEKVKEYRSSFKIYTFVNNKAESAGAMITLLGEKIYMTPDATIGSAAVIPYSEKTNSAWASMLRAQAEAMGRRGDIAQGMADYNYVISGIKEKGSLINLSATDAIRYKYCDDTAADITELVNKLGYRGNRFFIAKKDMKTIVSELVGNSYISALLLIIGITALIAEAFIPSFGILGTVGFSSITLYFLGNIFAGNTGWWSLALFILGIVFLGIEASIPGFGISGITGLISIAISIVLSAKSFEGGLITLFFVILVVIGTIFILIKYGMRSRLFKKIILDTKLEKHLNLENSDDYLIGKEGIALSALRPSGIAEVDSSRLNVQTNGEFITKNSRIQIVSVNGSKIIVKEKRG